MLRKSFSYFVYVIVGVVAGAVAGVSVGSWVGALNKFCLTYLFFGE